MTTVKELSRLLVRVLRDPARRIEHVKRFQQIVWGTNDLQADPEIARVLRDLAYDLDLFEPDERERAEDPALYGDARLEQEIRAALTRVAPGAVESIR